jgi:hypothetical protein
MGRVNANDGALLATCPENVVAMRPSMSKGGFVRVPRRALNNEDRSPL